MNAFKLPPNLYIATSLATTWLNEWIDVVSNLHVDAFQAQLGVKMFAYQLFYVYHALTQKKRNYTAISE